MKINLISGPRNISTALMYSFAQRSDTQVVDEPFYAYYLQKTGIDHPGRKETLDSMSSDLQVVLDQWVYSESSKPLLFIKNMAHHLIMEDLAFLEGMNNLFLIRDPERLITSFSKVIPNPTMQDIGLEREWELFNFIREKTGKDPIVMDSGRALENPRIILQKLCQGLEIPFEESMLSWEAGARKEDGSWAKYWYGSVHRSTGFSLPPKSKDPFPEHCRDLLEEALPFYHKLLDHSLTL